MKLLFFTSVKATHSQKWLRSLSEHFEVHVVSFVAEQSDRIDGITYHELLPAAPEKDWGNAQATRHEPPSIAAEAWLTFKNGIKFAKRFAEIIDQVKPEIVHAHQSVPFGWYAVRALTRARHTAPLIVSVWGTDVMAYPEQHWLFKLMNYSVLKRATVLTATSLSLVTAAQRWTKRTNWLVIPFGVDQKLFAPKKSVSGKPIVFGMAKQLRFVGELDVYGFTTALRALALARRTRPELRLAIAGSGPREQYLKEIATKLGLGESVRFLGTVQPKKLGAVMATWDALLLPSRQESFGVVAVEAAAVGIPVLGARIGGVPEIVQEGITGRLLLPCSAEQLAKAMLALDAKLINSAHKHGPRLVGKKFSWDESVRRMTAAYRAVAGIQP